MSNYDDALLDRLKYKTIKVPATTWVLGVGVAVTVAFFAVLIINKQLKKRANKESTD